MSSHPDQSLDHLDHLGRLIKIAENSLGVIAVLRKENEQLRAELRRVRGKAEMNHRVVVTPVGTAEALM